MKNQSCCFTGHRKISEEDTPLVRERLDTVLRQLISEGVRNFYAGGALGFDTLAALAVLTLRKTFPQIRLVLVLPCQNQTRGWSSEDILVYEAIKDRADKVIYTSQHYFSGCMHLRNRYLVDHCGVCVCYLTCLSGGTRYTVDYCRRRGVPVLNLVEPLPPFPLGLGPEA